MHAETQPVPLLQDAAAVLEAKSRFEARGMEIMVLDYGRSEMPMHGVKVLVPGMRHFWARRGPGRLNSDPVAMSLLSSSSTEAEFNPIEFVL